MSDRKHTPGPWRVCEENESATTVIGGRWCDRIAEVFHWDGSSREESDANALLVAAAPELLSALQIMLHEFVELPEMAHTERAQAAKLARQAIAKAQGKGLVHG